MTEEIFPGYKFTEFSYVVSLLRPGDHPRPRAAEARPARSCRCHRTFTPLDNGDYLAAWDDHDLTRREMYRHSPRDAEAYDEYSRLMARAGQGDQADHRADAARPDSLCRRDLLGLLKLGQYGASLSEHETLHASPSS